MNALVCFAFGCLIRVWQLRCWCHPSRVLTDVVMMVGCEFVRTLAALEADCPVIEIEGPSVGLPKLRNRRLGHRL